MDIHKPKPWHGLREFLKEYLIIVVGVLTALAAEQLVEQLHWRHEVQLAREALGYDLRRAAGWAGAEAAESPCKAVRLAELRQVLNAAQATHRFRSLGWPGMPLSYAWHMRSWSTLTSGQVLPHIPNREQLILNAIAYSLETILPFQQTEEYAWGQLSNMAGNERPTSDAEIASLRSTLTQATFAATAERNVSGMLATFVLRSGYLSPSETSKAWEEGFQRGAQSPLCGRAPIEANLSLSPMETYLSGPPMRPGQQSTDTVGVAGALSTDR